MVGQSCGRWSTVLKDWCQCQWVGLLVPRSGGSDCPEGGGPLSLRLGFNGPDCWSLGMLVRSDSPGGRWSTAIRLVPQG